MINLLCLVLFSTSSYDRMIAITVDIEFMSFLLWRDRYTGADSQVFGLLHKLWLVHSKQV